MNKPNKGCLLIAIDIGIILLLTSLVIIFVFKYNGKDSSNNYSNIRYQEIFNIGDGKLYRCTQGLTPFSLSESQQRGLNEEKFGKYIEYSKASELNYITKGVNINEQCVSKFYTRDEYLKFPNKNNFIEILYIPISEYQKPTKKYNF